MPESSANVGIPPERSKKYLTLASAFSSNVSNCSSASSSSLSAIPAVDRSTMSSPYCEKICRNSSNLPPLRVASRKRRGLTPIELLFEPRRESEYQRSPAREADRAARDQMCRARGRASASVGDKYVTIEFDRELAKPEVIEHGAHAAPDQSLDFLGSASQLCTLPCRACASRARKHRIFSGEPSFATPPPPSRN